MSINADVQIDMVIHIEIADCLVLFARRTRIVSIKKIDFVRFLKTERSVSSSFLFSSSTGDSANMIVPDRRRLIMMPILFHGANFIRLSAPDRRTIEKKVAFCCSPGVISSCMRAQECICDSKNNSLPKHSKQTTDYHGG